MNSTQLTLAGLGTLAAVYGLAVHEFPVELTGEVSASCNVSTTVIMDGQNPPQVLGSRYECPEEGLKAFFLDTGEGQYYFTLEKPFPQTKDNELFDLADRAAVQFNASVLNTALNELGWYLEKKNNQNYQYSYTDTYGFKNLEIPAESITVLAPE